MTASDDLHEWCSFDKALFAIEFAQRRRRRAGRVVIDEAVREVVVAQLFEASVHITPPTRTK